MDQSTDPDINLAAEPLKFSRLSVRPALEVETEISRLKPGESMEISHGQLGVDHKSVIDGHATITFKGGEPDTPGKYHIVDNSSGKPGISIQDSDLIRKRVSEITVPAGTAVYVGDYLITLPANVNTTDPYVQLRAPETNMQSIHGITRGREGGIHHEGLYGSGYGYTYIGNGKKENQEDTLVRISTATGRDVLAVFDGMGGYGAGEVAADVGARAFAYRARTGGTLQQCADVVGGAIRKEYTTNGRGAENMGTCMSACEITSDTVRFAHIGDSRAILFRPKDDGSYEVIHKTKDHSKVEHKYGHLVDQGVMDERELLDKPGRNKVYKSYRLEGGKDVSAAPTVSDEIEIKRGDVVFMASDGVWDNVVTDEIGRILQHTKDMPEAMAMIKALVDERVNLQKGKDDNTTLYLYRHEY